jgi:hypothetical protein
VKIGRDTLLAASALILLLGLTVALSFYEARREQTPPLSSRSNAPDGARALRLWLEALGHQVNNQSPASFAVPPGTDAVLILEPLLISNITAEEWEALEEWTTEGGWLLLASSYIRLPLLSSPLEVETVAVTEGSYSAAPGAPLFRSPPLARPVSLPARYLLRSERADALPLLVTGQGALAMEVGLGQGRVLLVASPAFLTNSGLRDADQARLALNLITLLPPGSTVWIDEWHHGERASQPAGGGLAAWLARTPAGRAVLFTVGVIFLAIALAGRRFGRPVPLAREQARRAPLEYVTALANLNRRAGHRRALMHSYHSSLKRALGRRYRLDPDLPDPEYVAQIARYNPRLDAPALLDLLRQLSGRGYRETELVQLARKAADWMRAVERGTGAGENPTRKEFP